MNYAGFTRQVWCWLRGARVPRDLPGAPRRDPGHHRAAGGRLPAGLPRAHSLAVAARELEHPRQPRHRADPHGRRLRRAPGGRSRPGRRPARRADGLRRRRDRRRPAVGRGRPDSFPLARPGAWDHDTLDAYRALLGIRAREPRAGRRAGCRWLHVGNDAIAFVREHPEESLLVVAARSQAEPSALAALRSQCPVSITCSASTADVVAGQAVIDVPSAGAGVWRVEGV